MAAACWWLLLVFPGPDQMRVTIPVDMDGRKNKAGSVKEIRWAVPEGPELQAPQPVILMGAFRCAVLHEAQRSGIPFPEFV